MLLAKKYESNPRVTQLRQSFPGVVRTLKTPDVEEIPDAPLSAHFRSGELSEWGAPIGRGGRELLLARLIEQNPAWVLWVCGKPELQVYPPAWMARGVNLARVRFAYTTHPVRDLKPVFLDSFFRTIVLDAPKYLSNDDCAFLAQRARAQKQNIIIIRDYFLSPRQGNVWAKARLNCWCDDAGRFFHVNIVRGASPHQMVFDRQTFALQEGV